MSTNGPCPTCGRVCEDVELHVCPKLLRAPQPRMICPNCLEDVTPPLHACIVPKPRVMTHEEADEADKRWSLPIDVVNLLADPMRGPGRRRVVEVVAGWDAAEILGIVEDRSRLNRTEELGDAVARALVGEGGG